MSATPRHHINPYKQFYGAWLPLWLLERQEISPGAKLVYACLARHAGEDGRCFPGHDFLIKEIGLRESNKKTLIRYIEELVEYDLIEKNRRGLNRSNEYFFLFHEWMQNDIKYQKNHGIEENVDSIRRCQNDTSGSVILSVQEVVKTTLPGSQKKPVIAGENAGFSSLREKEEKNNNKRVTTTTRKTVVVADAEDLSSNERIEDEETPQKQHLLTEIGITSKKAHELALAITLEQIKSIIAYAEKSNPENFPAFVISGLENGWKVTKKSSRPKTEYLTFDPNRKPRELSEFEIAAKEASLRRAAEYRKENEGITDEERARRQEASLLEEKRLEEEKRLQEDMQVKQRRAEDRKKREENREKNAIIRENFIKNILLAR
ncbi:MAG: helix-turn-helix domain-containing protein [Leptospirillum sp.]|jgi:hypothetical protein